jgi:hypothetical protein
VVAALVVVASVVADDVDVVGDAAALIVADVVPFDIAPTLAVV